MSGKRIAVIILALSPASSAIADQAIESLRFHKYEGEVYKVTPDALRDVIDPNHGPVLTRPASVIANLSRIPLLVSAKLDEVEGVLVMEADVMCNGDVAGAFNEIAPDRVYAPRAAVRYNQLGQRVPHSPAVDEEFAFLADVIAYVPGKAAQAILEAWARALAEDPTENDEVLLNTLAARRLESFGYFPAETFINFQHYHAPLIIFRNAWDTAKAWFDGKSAIHEQPLNPPIQTDAPPPSKTKKPKPLAFQPPTLVVDDVD